MRTEKDNETGVPDTSLTALTGDLLQYGVDMLSAFFAFVAQEAAKMVDYSFGPEEQINPSTVPDFDETKNPVVDAHSLAIEAARKELEAAERDLDIKRDEARLARGNVTSKMQEINKNPLLNQNTIKERAILDASETILGLQTEKERLEDMRSDQQGILRKLDDQFEDHGSARDALRSATSELGIAENSLMQMLTINRPVRDIFVRAAQFFGYFSKTETRQQLVKDAEKRLDSAIKKVEECHKAVESLGSLDELIGEKKELNAFINRLNAEIVMLDVDILDIEANQAEAVYAASQERVDAAKKAMDALSQPVLSADEKSVESDNLDALDALTMIIPEPEVVAVVNEATSPVTVVDGVADVIPSDEIISDDHPVNEPKVPWKDRILQRRKYIDNEPDDIDEQDYVAESPVVTEKAQKTPIPTITDGLLLTSEALKLFDKHASKYNTKDEDDLDWDSDLPVESKNLKSTLTAYADTKKDTDVLAKQRGADSADPVARELTVLEKNDQVKAQMQTSRLQLLARDIKKGGCVLVKLANERDLTSPAIMDPLMKKDQPFAVVTVQDRLFFVSRAMGKITDGGMGLVLKSKEIQPLQGKEEAFQSLKNQMASVKMGQPRDVTEDELSLVVMAMTGLGAVDLAKEAVQGVGNQAMEAGQSVLLNRDEVKQIKASILVNPSIIPKEGGSPLLQSIDFETDDSAQPNPNAATFPARLAKFYVSVEQAIASKPQIDEEIKKVKALIGENNAAIKLKRESKQDVSDLKSLLEKNREELNRLQDQLEPITQLNKLYSQLKDSQDFNDPSKIKVLPPKATVNTPAQDEHSVSPPAGRPVNPFLKDIQRKADETAPPPIKHDFSNLLKGAKTLKTAQKKVVKEGGTTPAIPANKKNRLE